MHEEPVHEEPVHEEPVHEEPVYDEPVHEEPVHGEPVHEEPVYTNLYEEPVHEYAGAAAREDTAPDADIPAGYDAGMTPISTPSTPADEASMLRRADLPTTTTRKTAML